MDAMFRIGRGDMNATMPGPEPIEELLEEVSAKGKLLKVDSSIHFQTEPESSRIYGSGYFTIETSDLTEARSRRARIKNGDIILYKVKTTGPLVFSVRPTISFLRSKQYACIHVRANSSETGESIGKYKFQVQALVVPVGHRFLTERPERVDDYVDGIEDGEDKDALYALWNELSRIPGMYIERHKLVVQVHPVAVDHSALHRGHGRHAALGLQTSNLQRMGVTATVVLLVWLAMKLFVPWKMF